MNGHMALTKKNHKKMKRKNKNSTEANTKGAQSPNFNKKLSK